MPRMSKLFIEIFARSEEGETSLHSSFLFPPEHLTNCNNKVSDILVYFPPGHQALIGGKVLISLHVCTHATSVIFNKLIF